MNLEQLKEALEKVEALKTTADGANQKKVDAAWSLYGAVVGPLTILALIERLEQSERLSDIAAKGTADD